MRVLSVNVWNKQGPYPERLPLLRRELAALGADIVGLQEILRLDRTPGDHRPDGPDNNQACELADGLGYYTAFAPASIVGGSLGGGLTFGNAILSRWPITDAHSFRLPGEAGQEPRGLLFARIASPHGRVPFFVTHLDWQFHHGAVRERQVVFIADRVHELAPGGRDEFPAILVGDFNAEPDSDEIRYLQGLTSLRGGRSVYFADCFRVAGDGSSGTTFSKRNPFAAPLGEPERRIDYIFSRGPDRQQRGRPLSCRVVCDVPEGDLFPTDHFGVLADLSVGPPPPPA